MTAPLLYVFTLYAGLVLTTHCTLLGRVKRDELPNQIFTLADNVQLDIIGRRINFKLQNNENNAVLKGELGTLLPEDFKTPQHCDDDQDNCMKFGDTMLSVTHTDKCYDFNWVSLKNQTLSDCFNYGDDNWYGGPENNFQYWPFNNMTFHEFAYIQTSDQNQAVAERYWLNSKGYYIYVNKSSPLFIDSNSMYNQSLCLIAKQTPPYLPRGNTLLSYKVCTYKNARVAHMHAIKNELKHPTGIPDQRMVEHPVWSTWVRFKLNVNQSAVMDFANQIKNHGFNNSQLEIDDDWETCYGDATFNKSRFPDMPKLGSDLHDMGFRVTLWTHPFINENCELFNELKKKGFLVENQSGHVVSSWWDGKAGVIDFTNPDAAQWYLQDRNATLIANNIDSLKFDAGESSWLPQIPKLNGDIDDQPQAFTAAYVRTVSQFGPIVEARTGHCTQDLPMFIRMIDKDSKWTFENGLPTLITTMFQMNLNGYPFVLPDMVGGNAYNSDVVTKELFIRWLQANVFMPSIQLSVAPWDFDNETIAISKKFTALHYQYSGEIIDQMKKSVRTGEPVNTPIWWVAPEDPDAHAIWSEYMLGEDILVAPVVEEGATTRNIYLPKGHWRDEADPSHKVYNGNQWLLNYPAPLDVLPFFRRVSHS